MAYGTVKVDSITFTNGGIDQTVTVSGIVQSISGNITATGTIQAATIIGTSTVSGATVTGDSGQYGNLNSISGVFTTQLSGATITGNTGQYATLTGISGVFTTQISGTTITGDTGQYTTLTGISGVFTTQVSGTTVTGDAGSFTTVTGGVATITSGVFALGTDSLPSISFSSDPNTGIYSPGADQVAISTSGTPRVQFGTSEVVFNDNGNDYDFRIEGDTVSNLFFVDASADKVGLGTSSPSSKLHVAGGATVVSIGSNDAGDTGAAIFYGTSTKYNWKIGAQQNVDNAFEITRSTAAGGTTFSTPSLVINSSGNVGVGTTPDSPLHVVGTDGTGLRIGYTNNTNYFDANTQVFRSNNATTTYGQWDSSGRLLVGTPSAFSAGGDAQYGRLHMVGNTSVSTGHSILALGRGEAATAITTDEALGYITFSDNAGNTFASIHSAADANAGSGDYPGRLVFSTCADGASSPTERMRISNTGVLYTFSSATGGNYFAVSAAAGTTTSILRGAYSATANALDGTESIRIWSNGDVVNTNNSYGALSDIKLKENIVDASSQWDDIKALRPVNYNFKEGQTHTQLGLIAQEVELVSPGLVNESPDRDEDGNDLGTVTKSVKYSVLYMKAVKALQEAMERIETLEAKVAALEAN